MLFHEAVRKCEKMLDFEINFGGSSSDTPLAFLKMASADGYFLYEDDFDGAITIADY